MIRKLKGKKHEIMEKKEDSRTGNGKRVPLAKGKGKKRG